MMRRVSGVLACVSVCFGLAGPVSGAEPQEYLAAVRAQLDVAAADDDFVGLAVAIIDKGELALLKTYGETEVNGGDKVGPDTVFRLASVSKGFATTLVGQLHAEGQIDWNDRVTEHAPSFRLRSSASTRRVRVADIASHQTGLPSYAYDKDLEAGVSMSHLLAKTGRTAPVCPPRDCYRYQNITFSLLGDVVEKADGGELGDIADERLFEPLGMETASVGLAELLNSPSWAKPHRRRGKRGAYYWQTMTPNEAYYRVPAAGGFNASIWDMAQWVRAQLGHEPGVIAPEVLERIHTPVVSTPSERNKARYLRSRVRQAEYALGWRVYDYLGEELVYHAGGVAGYRAFVALLPEHDFGVVAMWNSANSKGWRIMPTVVDAYLGVEPRDWLDVGDQIMADVRALAEEDVMSGSP